MLRPRFQWVLEASRRGETQTAYQVLVATSRQMLDQDHGNQWDTGEVLSANSTQVVYRGKPLLSGHAYYWKVRFWDGQGDPSVYSQPGRFEMGLLSHSDWKGEWIGGGLLRKQFDLPATIVRARAYVAALGYYDLYINGRKIGHRVLDPAWTTYPKRVLYSTYDVTAALR